MSRLMVENIYLVSIVFFFQAEDGIRDLVRSRGLGDVYKRQAWFLKVSNSARLKSGLCICSQRPKKSIENLVDIHFIMTNLGSSGFLALAISVSDISVSYTHLRAHATVLALVCRLLFESQLIHVYNILLFIFLFFLTYLSSPRFYTRFT